MEFYEKLKWFEGSLKVKLENSRSWRVFALETLPLENFDRFLMSKITQPNEKFPTSNWIFQHKTFQLIDFPN